MMADVSRIESGHWGFSRIVSDGTRGWTTHAMQQNLATRINAHYPPLVGGLYLVPYAMVLLNGSLTAPVSNDTILIPSEVTMEELTLGDLTAPQRMNLRNFLDTLVAHQFTDWDGSLKSIAGLSALVATYTGATTIRDLLRDVYRYLGHSASRERPMAPETHNTEYTDDFSTDPASRWTAEIGAAVWDSGNSEYDLDDGIADSCIRYSANGPGSIDHEAQATFLSDCATTSAGGGAVRFDNAGVDDLYGTLVLDWGNQNQIRICRWNAAARTTISTQGTFTIADNEWVTMRLAAEGTVGSNVVLSLWALNHGASKPTDPGWYGTNGSPGWTYTDTSADRLDATSHSQCGMSSQTGGVGFDTRHSFFKLRAISDRGGATGNPWHYYAQQ